MSKRKQEMEEALEIKWKDRKRILGMPISFIRYIVEEERFICRKGFFRTETDEILLYRILDIKMVQTLGQKIFGVGNITLYSTDQTDNRIDLVNVKNPEKVRRLLGTLVEDRRTEKQVAGRELYGKAGHAGHEPFEEDHSDWE